jgi:8-oxo-dGTP diphosphatase
MSFWAGMRYCPKCGTPFGTGGFERTMFPTCDACGFVFFRGPSLASGCMVVENGRLLLAKRGIEPYDGSWYVPSGFVDYGETPEAAAVRELAEETELIVRILGLYDVRAWHDDPRKDGVMLFYRAERVAGEAKAGDDAREIGWFAPNELPENIAFAVHRAAIHRWRLEETNFTTETQRSQRTRRERRT